MLAKVYVTLKKAVLDPQGKAVGHSLESLGFKDIQGIRQGKLFEINMNDMPVEEAKKQLDEMCKKLLSNTVIEDYHFEII